MDPIDRFGDRYIGVRRRNFLKESELDVEIFVDGELYEQTLMPTAFSRRKNEVAWKYNMSDGLHNVKVVLKDPVKGYGLHLSSVLIYGPEPAL